MRLGSNTSGVVKNRGSHRTTCLDGSRTKQEFVEETNINTLLKTWERTGQAEHLAAGTPQYGDFSNVTDYQTAVNAVGDAHDSFMELPSHIRARFKNDPAQLLDFVHDSANQDEAIKLGLVVDPADPPPGVPEEPPKEPESAPGE